MTTLSLAMIVKDEQRTLERILRQAANFCDQLVVVDTGSCDLSVHIAQNAGAEVHHFRWIDDFSAARNHALAKCTGDWVIWLDADDVVPAVAQEAILHHKSTLLVDSDVNTVLLPYQLDWEASGAVREEFLRERLIRRTDTLAWHGRVHEVPCCLPNGMVTRHDAWVEHRPHPDNMARKVGRNLAIYERYIDVESADVYTLYQYACELHWNHRLHDAACAFEAMLQRAEGSSDVMGTFYLARLKAGECRVQTGRSDLGMRHYQAAIALDPARAEALCLAGELCVDEGRLPEAVTYLSKAAKCRLPTSCDKQVFTWLYGKRPQSLLSQLA